MARLINADELETEFLCRLVDSIYTIPTTNVIKFIENAPTIDAVQIVRCKDCKHGHECYGVGMYSIVCEFSNYMNSPNGFCHEGKRKDGDTNGKVD